MSVLKPGTRRKRSALGAVAVLTALGVAGLPAAATPAAATPAAATPAAPAATAAPVSAACTTLRDVISVVTEAQATAADQAGSWVLLQANGWTVFAPNDDWALSASDAGADVNSPNGQDASLITWYSLGVPWTFKTLGAKFLGHLSHIDYLCRTGVARSASGESEAMELTGDLGAQRLHAVLILSMLSTSTETYTGESRYLYTPASQWSAANAKTLALIIRLAVQAPQNLG